MNDDAGGVSASNAGLGQSCDDCAEHASLKDSYGQLLAENARLRAALAEFLGITADPAGFTEQMMEKEGEALEQFIAEQEARVQAAIETARGLIGPNVRAKLPAAAR